MEDELGRVREVVAPVATPGRKPPTSAVLFPLVERPDGLHALYTRRAAGLTSHAGELSFPGGRIEADETPLGAALRETEEETGIRWSDVEVLGHLVDFLTFRDTVVSCWVGLLAPRTLERAPTRSPEVDDAFLLRLEDLRDPTRPTRARDVAGTPMNVRIEDVTGYELREWEGPDRTESRIHYWRLANGTTLWGITAHLTAILLERAFGWTPPVSPRRVARREDVLP